MTGVAAMMCARPPISVEIPLPAQLGTRKAILNDLSPAACHIAYNYCTPVDVEALSGVQQDSRGTEGRVRLALRHHP